MRALQILFIPLVIGIGFFLSKWRKLTLLFITIIIIISVSVAFAEELVKVNNNVIIPVSVPSDDSKLRQQIAMNTCVLAGF